MCGGESQVCAAEPEYMPGNKHRLLETAIGELSVIDQLRVREG